jgi:serine/threonine protein kinase
MSDKKFERFGKYLILDHLVDGGMAKICRARFLGEQANKIVAIKMVQPQYSNDVSFVKMFQDELNITFGMLHPNVMQVYDYGKVNNQLYTAMEYVDGANLKQYLDRLKEINKVFPVEICVYIISQACQGLHYAHTFTDKLTGNPLQLVHRDISPHNIMLTYDGAVKVIDFGIAKANTNSEATQAGTIKGKLSYLAPEYLDGLELDCRYDLFATGITLWEMLCGRKLFHASNDLAVLKQIQACKITPPSAINPTVPKELDAIVMKALSKDRNNRYEDMDKFNRALVKFLYSNFPDFNSTDLSYFAKQLFKDEIAKDKIKFVDYGKIDVAPYIEEIKREESGQGPKSQAVAQQGIVSDPSVMDIETRQKRLELELSDSDKSVSIELSHTMEPGGTRKVSRAVVKNSGAAGPISQASRTGMHKIQKGNGPVSKDKTTTRSIKAEDLDKEEKKSSKVFILIVAGFVGFAYFQASLVEEFTGFNLHKMIHGEAPQRNISSLGLNAPEDKEKIKAPEIKNGKIALNGVDVSMEVYINGQKQNYVGTTLLVPLNEEMTLLVKKPGHKTFMRTFSLTENSDALTIEVPELATARSGLLSSSLNYPEGSKLIYSIEGEVVEREMPFKDIQIPEGSYKATIKNSLLGTEKEVEFLIEENKKHFLE